MDRSKATRLSADVSEWRNRQVGRARSAFSSGEHFFGCHLYAFRSINISCVFNSYPVSSLHFNACTEGEAVYRDNLRMGSNLYNSIISCQSVRWLKIVAQSHFASNSYFMWSVSVMQREGGWKVIGALLLLLLGCKKQSLWRSCHWLLIDSIASETLGFDNIFLLRCCRGQKIENLFLVKPSNLTSSSIITRNFVGGTCNAPLRNGIVSSSASLMVEYYKDIIGSIYRFVSELICYGLLHTLWINCIVPAENIPYPAVSVNITFIPAEDTQEAVAA